jgi:hypothetical protein
MSKSKRAGAAYGRVPEGWDSVDTFTPGGAGMRFPWFVFDSLDVLFACFTNATEAAIYCRARQGQGRSSRLRYARTSTYRVLVWDTGADATVELPVMLDAIHARMAEPRGDAWGCDHRDAHGLSAAAWGRTVCPRCGCSIVGGACPGEGCVSPTHR